MALNWGNTAQPRNNQYARKTNLAMTAELTLANGNDGYGGRMNQPNYSTKAIGQRGNTYFERPATEQEISQAKGSLALLKSKKMKPSTTTNGDREEGQYALNSMLKYQPDDFQFQNPVPRRGGDGQFNTMDLSANQPGKNRRPMQQMNNQYEENQYQNQNQPDEYTRDLYHQNNGNYRRQFKPPTQTQNQYEQEEPRTAYGNTQEASTRKDRLLNRVNNTVQNQPNAYEKPAYQKPAEIELPEEAKMNGKSRLNRLNTRKVEERTPSQEPRNVGGFGGAKNNNKNNYEEEEYQPPARGKPAQQNSYEPSAMNNKPKGRPQQINKQQSSNPEDERPAFAGKGSKDPNAGVPEDANDDDGTRVECPEGCGRKFNEDALEKHVRICKKVFQTKRKEFDSAAARAPEDENGYTQKPSKNKKAAPPGKAGAGGGKSKWQAQSEAFRAAMRAGKGQELTADQKQSLKEAEEVGMLKCPSCGRKFNETAGKRHIPVCAAKAKNDEMKKGPVRRR